jgi:hypothetical protein
MTDVGVAIEDLELGPIDYLVIEYPNGRPTGEALPYLLDLVDRGLVRILDVGIVAKAPDGSFESLRSEDLADLGESGLAVFEGASSGILDDSDLEQVAAVIGDGAVGAILVYENTWAGPFAAALRRAGGQLVSSGRIPVQAVLDALAEIQGADEEGDN